MQKVLAGVALAALCASSAPAQQLWQREIGIQGGFARLKPAGSGQADHLDAITLPGFSLGNLIPATGGLYVVFPWKRAIAIETDIAASQFTTGITVTTLSLGLRGNYAITDKVYGAAGGVLAYNNGLANETQLGVQAALGYRLRLSGSLNGRVEARAAFLGNSENFGPLNAYSLLVGVSTPTGRSRAARGTTRGGGRTRAWTPQFGIAGGYANVHLVGGASLSALAFPGYGGALGPLTTYQVTLPPTLFAILPVGNKIAIEPGLDIHRFQEANQTDFSGNLSARLNYAVRGGWYGALGGNLHYIKTTGVDGTARMGLNLAWGYRFALAGPFGGRVELNYTMFGESTDLGLGPANTFGLMFGTTVPLR